VSEPQNVAGSLIDALAKQGEHVDEGGFTIDPATALRKLREHQLADPHDYVLLLVEAACIAGDSETGVHIQTGAMTTVEFGGVTIEPESLRELFTAVLGGLRGLEGDALRHRRVLQLLGLAANNALALKPLVITIDARDASGKIWRLRMDASGEQILEPGLALEHSTVRFSLHGGGMLEGWRATVEREHVFERCRLSSFPIHLGSDRVSQGPDSGMRRSRDLPIPVRLAGLPIGLAGHAKDLKTPASCWIVNRGVVMETVELAGPAGIVSVVEVDLPTDLSRQQLLHGPEFDAVMDAIRDAVSHIDRPRYDEHSDLKPGTKPMPFGYMMFLVFLATVLLFWVVEQLLRN
jgi:hypothetical protein